MWKEIKSFENKGGEEFERHYLSLRKKEGRVLTDEEVLQLPHIAPGNMLFSEWKVRKYSAEKLVQYLQKRKSSFSVLEIGCGNGWLSNYIANIPGAVVTGLDINGEELAQASKLFPRVHFIKNDIRNMAPGPLFDYLIFAASIQYFKPLAALIEHCLLHLKPAGEIHIIDSPFYQKTDVTAAAKRTASYFETVGGTEMNNYYFHHCFEDLQAFNFTQMNNKWFKRINPFDKAEFPWLRIIKNI